LTGRDTGRGGSAGESSVKLRPHQLRPALRTLHVLWGGGCVGGEGVVGLKETRRLPRENGLEGGGRQLQLERRKGTGVISSNAELGTGNSRTLLGWGYRGGTKRWKTPEGRKGEGPSLIPRLEEKNSRARTTPGGVKVGGTATGLGRGGIRERGAGRASLKLDAMGATAWRPCKPQEEGSSNHNRPGSISRRNRGEMRR